MPAAAGGHVQRRTPLGSVIPRVTPTATDHGPDHHRTTGQSHSHSSCRNATGQERTRWTSWLLVGAARTGRDDTCWTKALRLVIGRSSVRIRPRAPFPQVREYFWRRGRRSGNRRSFLWVECARRRCARPASLRRCAAHLSAGPGFGRCTKMALETGSPRPGGEVDRGRHDSCGCAAIPHFSVTALFTNRGHRPCELLHRRFTNCSGTSHHRPANWSASMATWRPPKTATRTRSMAA